MNPSAEGAAPDQSDDREILTLTAAAERLRLPESTLISALRRGLLEGFQDADGGWLVVLAQAPAYHSDNAAGGGTSGDSPAAAENEVSSEEAVARLGAAIESLKQDVSRLDSPRPAVAEGPFGAATESAPPEEPPVEEPPATATAQADSEPSDRETRTESETSGRRRELDEEIAALSRSIGSLLTEEEDRPTGETEALRDEIAYLRRELKRRDEIIDARDALIAKLVQRVAETSDRLIQMLPGEATVTAQVEAARTGFQAAMAERDRDLERVRNLLQTLQAILGQGRAGRDRRGRGDDDR